ncbi:MAG: hypothetical protein V4717_13985 [Bacteroidota bacterium]
MENNQKIKKETENDQQDTPIKPDPETLHTTDPQENMKGPVSSLMQGLKEEFEETDADKEKEIEKEKD